MKSKILQETFSIENVSLSQRKDTPFLEIREGDLYCQVVSGMGHFKCLRINTTYSPSETGILLRVAEIFTKSEISIFAFTSIDCGYFFFEEKFQNRVETSILGQI